MVRHRGRSGRIIVQTGAERLGAYPPVEKAGGSQVQVFSSQTAAPRLADGSECRVPRVGVARLPWSALRTALRRCQRPRMPRLPSRSIMTSSPNPTLTTFQVVDRLEIGRAARDALAVMRRRRTRRTLFGKAAPSGRTRRHRTRRGGDKFSAMQSPDQVR
jgi:hypothetical protein